MGLDLVRDKPIVTKTGSSSIWVAGGPLHILKWRSRDSKKKGERPATQIKLKPKNYYSVS